MEGQPSGRPRPAPSGRGGAGGGRDQPRQSLRRVRFCAPHAEEGRASPWTSPGLSQVSSQVCIRSAAGLGRPRKAKEELKEAGGLGRKGGSAQRSLRVGQGSTARPERGEGESGDAVGGLL